MLNLFRIFFVYREITAEICNNVAHYSLPSFEGWYDIRVFWK
jgi:hypothetical protein